MLFKSSFFACLTAAIVSAGPASAADGGAQTLTFQSPQGDTYFAVGVPSVAETPGAKNHLLLIDTSASQIGDYRTLSHDVAKLFVASLPADHTVCLVAIDVQSVPMTEGFVPVRGDAIDAAFAKLARRAPLGATNLDTALRNALTQIETTTNVAVAYVGDGMSAAQLLSTKAFTELTAQLRHHETPVNSVAVGPQTDLNLLGVLAAQTGGVVILENESSTAEAMAAELVAAVSTGVTYADSLTLTNTDAKLAVSSGLPLRSDRLTFVLGRGELSGDEAVVVTSAAKKQQFAITQPENAVPYPFLASAWDSVGQTEGLTGAIPGAELVVLRSTQFDATIDGMVETGKLALSLQQYDKAREIAESIQNLDPTNLQSASLLAATDRRVRLVAHVQEPATPAPPTPGAGDEDLDQIGRVQDALRVRSEQLTLEVNNLIDQARKLSLTDADDALNNLKNALGTVRVSQDVFPEVREQLERRLTSVIQEVQGRKQVQDLQDRADTIRFTQQESLKRIDEEMRLDDEQFQQLLERVRSLMDEGLHGVDQAYEDAEAVSEEAINIRPESGVAWAAYFKAEASGQLTKAFRLRFRRADEFLATLYEVEKSHVPFPDEPPIRWPSPEVWQDMTERRAKWKRTNLKQNSPIEERILKVLDEPYKQAQFLGVPLSDVMNDIGSSKQIPWAADTDVEVSNTVDEIDMISNLPPDVYPSLRSVLRRVLGSLGYRYIIKDETLLIVTEDTEADMYFTYVYPVGDLVINPIQLVSAAQQLVGSAGGVGNGLTQGGGLNTGGQGGQQGGFGGQQGGNQGIFSVRPQAANRAVPQAGQQKPNAAQKQDEDDAKRLLDQLLGPQSSVTRPKNLYQAQVIDNRSRGLDNRVLDQLKKKL